MWRNSNQRIRNSKEMKIQINNLEALERLIGGDTQLEMDIRQNIVEAFTKKHLKSLANSEVIKQSSKIIQDEIEKVFQNSSRYGQVISDKYKEILSNYIKQEIQKFVNLEIRKVVDEVVSNEVTEEIIQYKIESFLNAHIKNVIRQEMADKLINVLRSDG